MRTPISAAVGEIWKIRCSNVFVGFLTISYVNLPGKFPGAQGAQGAQGEKFADSSAVVGLALPLSR